MPELYDMNRPGREPGMKKVSSNMIILRPRGAMVRASDS